jgi:hypothetical protein
MAGSSYLATRPGGDDEVQNMIEHWVSVIDRWVRKFDHEMGGGTADGADPAGDAALSPDSAPTPVPES